MSKRKKHPVLKMPEHGYYRVTGEVTVELLKSGPSTTDRKKVETRYAVYVDDVQVGFVESHVKETRGAKIGRNVSYVTGSRTVWRFTNMDGERVSQDSTRAYAVFAALDER